MIFGIGTDILQIERVRSTYARFGQHFVDRLLLPVEKELFSRSNQPVRFLAMRFAAKEAIVKAMGTGFSNGMWLRDSGVMPNKFGRPDIIFSKRGKLKCSELGVAGGHLTLTDEAGLVVAVAVLEKKESQ
ncbi:MAG: holo-[acyl-carrier-protein] synthase [Gammaproteobacteria bacterium]|nr:holo-[acyl-carrier-protein] synthase [Gammaproteobacteria bacterium]MCP4088787.1 holo-[acyl-carrier-protein] synthase [Gammaproteobacteria bacterium]MCP4275914.1 holo-[acyl-carrier-protein] synthase [Gammaproteobacteria bacterium]MCP4832130.1 holo-[acyl-carrier-protein] synthase [Gammaproteobacteria bacterium]MCP4928269.1 holo-[acyl-carrier-protein] synthase [Gammaproteobacteria bacterium]